jgi:hypothetical protein
MRFSHLDDVSAELILRKTAFFEPFIYKNDDFAKTGSGQT